MAMTTTAASIGEMYVKFEGAMAGVYASASAGISNYVIPIAWVLLSISLILWCLATMTGKTSIPILSWLTPGIAFMLVLHAMGEGYVQWFAEPIFKLPEDLATAVGYGASSNPIVSISSFELKFIAMMTGAFNLVVEYSETGAYGAAAVLIVISLVMGVACALMMIIIFGGVVYAKLGLTLVLSVGPFFLLMLMLQPMRDKFYSWLSTALYFSFYYLLCVLFVALFFSILDGYIGKITEMTSSSVGQNELQKAAEVIQNLFGGGDDRKTASIVVSFLPVILLSGVMAFMFLQLSTISASITSGSGGSLGQGASSLIFYASRILGSGAKK